MYPGYGRPQSVLDEYAITFYALLNEGYRIRNQHYLMMATIANLPRMEHESAKTFLTQLEWAAKDPGDILNPSQDASLPADLKKFFEGK